MLAQLVRLEAWKHHTAPLLTEYDLRRSQLQYATAEHACEELTNLTSSRPNTVCDSCLPDAQQCVLDASGQRCAVLQSALLSESKSTEVQAIFAGAAAFCRVLADILPPSMQASELPPTLLDFTQWMKHALSKDMIQVAGQSASSLSTFRSLDLASVVSTFTGDDQLDQCDFEAGEVTSIGVSVYSFLRDNVVPWTGQPLGPVPPPSCSTAQEFAVAVERVTIECCDDSGDQCDLGIPATCDHECSMILLPTVHACNSSILGWHSHHVLVQITTVDYANEISWNIDGGREFGPYDDNSVYEESVELSSGSHTFNYFDSYGDGWHGGYWTLIDPTDQTQVAGGEVEGQVSGAGGQTAFVIGTDEVVSLPATNEQQTITIHIHTLTWANEITWNIDDGQQFGVEPPFDDNADYYESVTLSTGVHTLYFFDTYGDGWHGGYWEMFSGVVDTSVGQLPILGGPTEGLVAGAGGEVQFTLDAAGSTGATISAADEVLVSVQITTFTWASEITWSIDDGITFGPYEDNSINEQTLVLSSGEHTFYYMDSYGDGWQGGYWTLINLERNSTIGGGPENGVVDGAGGSFIFALVSQSSSSSEPLTAPTGSSESFRTLQLLMQTAATCQREPVAEPEPDTEVETEAKAEPEQGGICTLSTALPFWDVIAGMPSIINGGLTSILDLSTDKAILRKLSDVVRNFGSIGWTLRIGEQTVIERDDATDFNALLTRSADALDVLMEQIPDLAPYMARNATPLDLYAWVTDLLDTDFNRAGVQCSMMANALSSVDWWHVLSIARPEDPAFQSPPSQDDLDSMSFPFDVATGICNALSSGYPTGGGQPDGRCKTGFLSVPDWIFAVLDNDKMKTTATELASVARSMANTDWVIPYPRVTYQDFAAREDLTRVCPVIDSQPATLSVDESTPGCHVDEDPASETFSCVIKDDDWSACRFFNSGSAPGLLYTGYNDASLGPFYTSSGSVLYGGEVLLEPGRRNTMTVEYGVGQICPAPSTILYDARTKRCCRATNDRLGCTSWCNLGESDCIDATDTRQVIVPQSTSESVQSAFLAGAVALEQYASAIPQSDQTPAESPVRDDPYYLAWGCCSQSTASQSHNCPRAPYSGT